MSSDPIGLSGGINTYGYALVSPMMYTDPEGLEVVGRWTVKPHISLIDASCGAAYCIDWTDSDLYLFRFSIHPKAEVSFSWECEDTCTGEKWDGSLSLDIGSDKLFVVEVPLPACFVAAETLKRLNIPYKDIRINVLRGACLLSIHLKVNQLTSQAKEYIELLANSTINDIMRAGATSLCKRREEYELE